MGTWLAFRWQLRRCQIILLCLGWVWLLAACASLSQTQYFAAIDPESNNINFYRIVIDGYSGLGNSYHFRAGYFNAITVDALTGSFSDPPEVKGNELQLSKVKEIQKLYYELLVAQATAAQNSKGPDALARIARSLWLAGLDDLSAASIGQTDSLNPYIFRKLVFWADAKPTDLQQLSGQVEDTFKNTMAVVANIQKIKAERKALLGGIGKAVEEAGASNETVKTLGKILTDATGGQQPSGTGQ
jgi:hypothetical protein